MSLQRIRSLIADALQLRLDATLLDDGDAKPLWAQAKRLLTDADIAAERGKPGIRHRQFGYGVAVGVGQDGAVDVTFGGHGEPFTKPLPVDELGDPS